MFLISNRSLTSRTRQDPGAATLMVEVDGETRMPEITSLYAEFKQVSLTVLCVGSVKCLYRGDGTSDGKLGSGTC
jgi:hypothetical protein